MKNFVVYGYKNDKKRKLGESNSYWEAVCLKEKTRKSGDYEKVAVEEKLFVWEKQARKECVKALEEAEV